jgi:hypothetical protein
VSPPYHARDARLPVGDFLGHQQGEETAIGPLLLLGAPCQVPLGAARVGQVRALEQRIELGVVRSIVIVALRRRQTVAPCFGRVQALRFAPALRAPAAAWTRPPRGAESAVAAGRASESCAPRENDSPGCPINDDRPAGRPGLSLAIGGGVATVEAR